MDLSCLLSWCWWSCASTPSPAWSASVARERRGRERRMMSFISILESRERSHHHVTLSQLSRTSQSAPLAHVTIIFYKKMLILINWCDIPNSVCWSGGCITVTGAPPPYHLAGQQHQQQDYCRLAVGIRLRLRSEEWGVVSPLMMTVYSSLQYQGPHI